MATNSVTFTINPLKYSKGSQCEHITSSTHADLTARFTAEAGSGSATAVSEIIIPLNLPKSAVITSMKFPLTNEVTTADFDGTSFALVVEGTQYGLDSAGNVTDINIYSHLNNYKTQHGVFPTLMLYASSWVLLLAEQSATVSFSMSPAKITAEIEGGESILRPYADVSAGHTIMSGFSEVSSLINESFPDDDTTYIESYSKTTDGDSGTSIVKLGTIPESTKLININFVLRTALKGSTISNGPADADMWLEIDGTTSPSISITNRVMALSGIISKSDSYITYEYALDSDDLFVQALNDYYKQNGIMPEIKAHLSTSACATESAKDTKDAQVRITQAYASAVYEYITSANMNIRRKSNGVWKQVLKAFQKQNGSWVEVTEEECKSIFNT